MRSKVKRIAAPVVLLALAGGCAAPPLGPRSDRIERSLVEGLLSELRDAREDAGPRPVERGEDEVQIDERFLDEVEALGGIDTYEEGTGDFGADLLGRPQRVATINLEQAIKAAAEHNLSLQFTRLDPAVAEAAVVRAEAVFDWVLFGDATFSTLETQVISGSAFQAARDTRDIFETSLGLRKQTRIGGTFAVEQEFRYTDVLTPDSPALTFTPDPAWETTFTIQGTQPLLRGFGTDVAQEALLIARNDEREQVANVKAEAINVVTQVETAYWDLWQAHHTLRVLQRLVDRGEETRREVRIRAGFDADPAEVADADATVADRRQTLRQAQTAVRDASDNLKVLMSDPRYPVGGTVLLAPVDTPVDQAIEYGYFDALQSALRRRPEMTQALLSLDSTAIRLRTAENGLLPRLDLNAQIEFFALEDDLNTAFVEAWRQSRQSYIFGVDFELPIGNRDAEALRDERRLQQWQAAIAYRNTVQDITAQVNSSLRRVNLNYALIGDASSTRRAAAENLRVFNAQKETTEINTPERLNLEFNRQDRLAAAEQSEAAALADYVTSIAELHAAMGTALERNGIRFIVPDRDELLRERR
ncbi:MAG: TolC family protein [Planctomycetota bacterium]